jgi:Fic family protein
MKIPLTPPPLNRLLAGQNPDLFSKIIKNSSPLIEGEYLHWDQLRHRTPPDGLTSEQWWAAIKFARTGTLKELPLLNKEQRLFLLGTPEPVLIDIHHIDRDAAGHVLSPTEATTPEHRTRYLFRSLMEEAITSSQLEGAATTRKVAVAMLREGRKPRDHSEQMIFNNYTAMTAIRDMKAAPITPERILQLHRILTEDTLDDPADAGRLRQSDDIQVVDHRDGTILHQPPSHRELSDRMERLCAFANADENARPFVHPVLRAILLHFMIGYDHPFVDGNGRTARAVFYWSMARSGYWLMEFLSISHFLRRAPSEYMRAYLYSETDYSDTTYFVLHQLEIIRKAVKALHLYLDRIGQEQRSTEHLLAASPSLRSQLNHRQVALLTHALKHPGEEYLVEAHQRTHGVVYETARRDLLALAALGLLIKSQAGRAFVFTAPTDLQARIAKLAEHSVRRNQAPRNMSSK